MTSPWGLDDVFPPDDLCSGPYTPFIIYIEGILQKGSYLPCVSMAGRALLTGYHRHIIYHSCRLSNWTKLFPRDIHTKSWCGHDGVLDDMILLIFPVWFQIYLSIVQLRILYIKIWTVLGVCAVLVLSVIMYSFYYFLDRVLFHHDFHYDSCDYNWDFYYNSSHFELYV